MMEVHQIIRSKRKTVTLIVRPDGSVIVRAPLRASAKSIKEFVQNNTKWIEKKRSEALAMVPSSPKQFIPGETFLYLGNPYPLEIVKDQEQPLRRAESFTLAEAVQSDAAVVFERWYREQARQLLQERVDVYARQFDLRYK